MPLMEFFKKKDDLKPERDLYEQIVRQARSPAFYRLWQVPDSLDGRFELIALHVFLVLQRLKDDPAAGGPLGQRLHDFFFADMDESLREMGAGDLGVGKRVKKMVQGFYGRISAYESGLAGAEGELDSAIRRNLYGTLPEIDAGKVAKMAGYLRGQQAHLASQEISDLVTGQVDFGPPPVEG